MSLDTLFYAQHMLFYLIQIIKSIGIVFVVGKHFLNFYIINKLDKTINSNPYGLSMEPRFTQH